MVHSASVRSVGAETLQFQKGRLQFGARVEIRDFHGAVHAFAVRGNGILRASESLIQFTEMVIRANIPGVIPPQGLECFKCNFNLAELDILGCERKSDERVVRIVRVE